MAATNTPTVNSAMAARATVSSDAALAIVVAAAAVDIAVSDDFAFTVKVSHEARRS